MTCGCTESVSPTLKLMVAGWPCATVAGLMVRVPIAGGWSSICSVTGRVLLLPLALVPVMTMPNEPLLLTPSARVSSEAV